MKAMRMFIDREGKLRISAGINVSESGGKYDLLLGMREHQRIVSFEKRNPPPVKKRASQPGRPEISSVYSFDLRLVTDLRLSKMCGYEVKYYLMVKAENERDPIICVHIDVKGSKGIKFRSSLDMDDLPCGYRVDDDGKACSPSALIALLPNDSFAVEFEDGTASTVRYDPKNGLIIESQPVLAAVSL